MSPFLRGIITCLDPYKFEEFVWEHFERQGHKVVALDGSGGRPDAVLVSFFGLHRTIVDAKAKERISFGDVDQVMRYVRKFHAFGGGRIYICHDAEVGPNQAKYAYGENVRIFRLGLNGRETELDLHEIAHSPR